MRPDSGADGPGGEGIALEQAPRNGAPAFVAPIGEDSGPDLRVRGSEPWRVRRSRSSNAGNSGGCAKSHASGTRQDRAQAAGRSPLTPARGRRSTREPVRGPSATKTERLGSLRTDEGISAKRSDAPDRLSARRRRRSPASVGGESGTRRGATAVCGESDLDHDPRLQPTQDSIPPVAVGPLARQNSSSSSAKATSSAWNALQAYRTISAKRTSLRTTGAAIPS